MRDRMDRIASTPNLCILSILFILSSPGIEPPNLSILSFELHIRVENHKINSIICNNLQYYKSNHLYKIVTQAPSQIISQYSQKHVRC